MQHDYYTSKKRLLTLIVAAIFLFLVIFLRLAYIQVIWGKELQAKAGNQWQRDLPIKAYRGDITDTNGNLIATTETGYGVYARPKSVVDAEACAKALAEILDMDYAKLLEKLTKKGVSEVTIKRQIDSAQVKARRQRSMISLQIPN